MQECRAERADCATRELQSQIQSNRMEIDHTNFGYGLHEELAQRERAFKETHVKSIQGVEELKRAPELRIDEFSRQELREDRSTINEHTSPI